jgi:hypothetical protein
MDTQILKLESPREYIYCNGSIGLHIATMIVYEAKVNDEGDYELVTHSHPVVKYANRPGGTVWNRAELTDCHVLCREDNKRITMEQFYDFISDMRHQEGDVDKAIMPVSIEAPLSKLNLEQNGIEIEWPLVRGEEGDDVPQEEFNIALDFKRNTESELCDYSCCDMGIADDAYFTGAAPLYFFARFNTKEDLKSDLINGMATYYNMFKDHNFRINYMWPEDSEFADVVDEVNKMEPEIRKDSNDIDV